MQIIRMYSEIASWFHLLTAPEDYAEEAGAYRGVLQQFVPQARTLLELGSGGGNNASHLKKDYQMTLVDLSPEMLDLSRSLNPELVHIQGDMRSLRLGRLFDAVFIHDAIMYMTTLDDLRRAIQTAFVHCRPGGAALFCPDCTRETFQPHTDHGGHDGENRSMRYLEWTWDPNPADTTYVSDYAYLLREANGEVRSLYDRHIMGLFSQEEWPAVIEQAGFAAHNLTYHHSEAGVLPLFLGIKP